eukprot:COSAG04_NODE_130_length_24323_cov_50.932835_4_plen_54_part_00
MAQPLTPLRSPCLPAARSVRRTGMNINYSLAFLAQEENQLLACPPHLARNLSP